jgi:hypothetical protein
MTLALPAAGLTTGSGAIATGTTTLIAPLTAGNQADAAATLTTNCGAGLAALAGNSGGTAGEANWPGRWFALRKIQPGALS